MFGVIIPGRPVLTNPQTISPTQFAFSIPILPQQPLNHIVVFFLPGNELPPDAAAAIYLRVPLSTEFKLLGAVANEKQSAVFRVLGSAAAGAGGGANTGAGGGDVMMDDTTMAAGTEGAELTLGISIEPAQTVAAALEVQKAAKPVTQSGTGMELAQNGQTGQNGVGVGVGVVAGSSLVPPPMVPVVPTKLLAQRIIANAFNFLASFAGGDDEVVPLKSFRDWWVKFEKKVELDPGFLEREQGV